MLRRALAGLAAAALAGGGVVAGTQIAASGGGTTGTISVCATASTPAHTVAVDGAGVTTITGDTEASCATTTVPTVTQTTTTGATSTIVPTTTTSPGAPTFASETAYTNTRPAFTAKRTINVATAAAFKTAIANLQAGDLVKATAPFIVSSSSGPALVLAQQLAAPAEIDLTAGVKFVYAGTSDVSAVYIHNAHNIWLFGGDASSGQGGSCILAHGLEYVRWWGFTAHDCGGGGISLLTAVDGGPIEHNDIEGEIWNVATHLAWDPHTEKGTGLHCAGEMADGQGGQPFIDNRLAFYCHNIFTGEAFAFGVSPLTPDLGLGAPGEKNTLILRATNLTCVATIQTCGNAVTLWGHTSMMGLDIKYLEADDITGYPIITNAVSAGYNLKGVTVDYARAANVMTHTYPRGAPMWGKPLGQAYGDVQPAP